MNKFQLEETMMISQVKSSLKAYAKAYKLFKQSTENTQYHYELKFKLEKAEEEHAFWVQELNGHYSMAM